MNEKKLIEPETTVKYHSPKDQSPPSVQIQDTEATAATFDQTTPEQRSSGIIINEKQDHDQILHAKSVNPSRQPEEVKANSNNVSFPTKEEQVKERNANSPAALSIGQNPENTADEEDSKLLFPETVRSEKNNYTEATNVQLVLQNQIEEKDPITATYASRNIIARSDGDIGEINDTASLIPLSDSEIRTSKLIKVQDIRIPLLSGAYISGHKIVLLQAFGKFFLFDFEENKLKEIGNFDRPPNAKIIRCLNGKSKERLFIAGTNYYLQELKILTHEALLVMRKKNCYDKNSIEFKSADKRDTIPIANQEKDIMILRKMLVTIPKKGNNIDDIIPFGEDISHVAAIIHDKGQAHIFEIRYDQWFLVRIVRNDLLRSQKNQILHFGQDSMIIASEIENSETKELRRVNLKTGQVTKYPTQYSINIWKNSDIKVIRDKQKITLLYLAANAENEDTTGSFPLMQLTLKQNDLDYESVVIRESQTFVAMKNFPMNRYALLTSEDQENWLMSVDGGEATFMVLSKSDWDPFFNNLAIDLGKNMFVGMNEEGKVSVYRLEDKEKSSEGTTKEENNEILFLRSNSQI